ncbi:MAG: glycosyltransferase family 2 protein [Eggerthella lenta]|nr:glycosyltransferase family 2 protein [Eggerthella lenta]
MSDTPIVSIVVPAYNGERHIRQCVESVLAQTMPDFELICVNDGSTDGTGSLLDDMAARDDRMRVIHQENKGEGAARNAGLDVARGRYLAFFDADDFAEPQLLEKVVRRAEETGADVVAYRVDSYNDETGETLPMPGRWTPTPSPPTACRHPATTPTSCSMPFRTGRGTSCSDPRSYRQAAYASMRSSAAPTCTSSAARWPRPTVSPR